MKSTRKIVSLLLSAVILTGVTAGCSSGTAPSSSAPAAASTASTAGTTSTSGVEGSLKDVTIKVGTSGLFGPFSYYDKDGKTLIGYDLDMIKELQKILGFKIDGDVQAMDYAALTASVTSGKLDMAAAALCATDERKKVMLFSNTYEDSGQVIMINTDNDEGIKGLADLKGKTVAVEKGTASHTYADKNLKDSKIEIHDTITTAYAALEQKKVDAVIQDGPGVAFYVKTTTGTKLKAVGDQFNQGQAPYAIAFNKDFKYVDQFNAALKIMTDNGTMKKLEDTWCK